VLRTAFAGVGLGEREERSEEASVAVIGPALRVFLAVVVCEGSAAEEEPAIAAVVELTFVLRVFLVDFVVAGPGVGRGPDVFGSAILH